MLFNTNDMHILVVEDDRSTADSLVEYLSGLGYSATPAYGGVEGLRMFQEGDYQLVITDLKMPEIDGMDLLRAVKKMDSEVAVIVISGYGSIESAVKAIKNGAYDFIKKQFKLEEIEKIIKRAAERHTLFKQLGIFRGLTLALIISVPFWLALGIIVTMISAK
jgi:two-component system response regulator HydG